MVPRTVALGVVMGAAFVQAADSSNARQVRIALLAELRPVALRNCVLERFGGQYDGGYLMCGNLIAGLESAYSYGVGPFDDWGCHISSRFRVPVHQYDCFDPSRPVCATGQFLFHDECVGDRGAIIDGHKFNTFENQVAVNGDRGRRIVVKMDIEGGEWDTFAATPDAVLARIAQLAIELHGVNERRFLDVVRKLKRTFYVANLHFNNHACSSELSPFPASAYQVLFINKRLGILGSRQAAASALNAPDNPARPDCQLD